MRKDPVEFRTQIARRRKKFFALLLGVALGVMPTVTVMAAETYELKPASTEEKPESTIDTDFDAALIKPVLPDGLERVQNGDLLKWNKKTNYYDNNGEAKGISGQMAALYYSTDGQTLLDGEYLDDFALSRGDGIEVKKIGEYDRWKVSVSYMDYNAPNVGNPIADCIAAGSIMSDEAWKPTANPNTKGVVLKLQAVTEYNVYFDPSYPVESRLEGLGKTTKDHKISEDDLNEVSQYVSERLPEGGYDLEGFYTERDGKGDKITKDYKFSSNTTAYANWVKKCKVTFNSNYPDKSKEKTEVKTTKNGKIESFPKFTFEGYTLEGFSKTRDGEIISKNTVFEKDTDLYAIWKKGDKPDDPDKGSGDHDDDDDDEVVKKDDKPAYYDPFALNGHYYVNNVIDGGAVLARSQQGPAAMAAFMNGLPAGWKMAFPFVISTGGKNDYSLKNGTIKLEVPSGNQGKGREFAIMAIDKNGLVTVIYDTDKTENHITVSPNVEGYAYMLIYKD